MQEQDIISKINGKIVAWEYERYNNKNLDIIVQKKAAALEKVIKFGSFAAVRTRNISLKL